MSEELSFNIPEGGICGGFIREAADREIEQQQEELAEMTVMPEAGEDAENGLELLDLPSDPDMVLDKDDKEAMKIAVTIENIGEVPPEVLYDALDLIDNRRDGAEPTSQMEGERAKIIEEMKRRGIDYKKAQTEEKLPEIDTEALEAEERREETEAEVRPPFLTTEKGEVRAFHVKQSATGDFDLTKMIFSVADASTTHRDSLSSFDVIEEQLRQLPPNYKDHIEGIFVDWEGGGASADDAMADIMMYLDYTSDETTGALRTKQAGSRYETGKSSVLNPAQDARIAVTFLRKAVMALKFNDINDAQTNLSNAVHRIPEDHPMESQVKALHENTYSKLASEWTSDYKSHISQQIGSIITGMGFEAVALLRSSKRAKQQYLYTMKDFMKEPRVVEIDDQGIITNIDGQSTDTPVEDYGDYFLTDAPVENAFDMWASDSKSALLQKNAITRDEAYQMGKDRGEEMASYSESAEDAFEAEEHARQYSPFEFTANEFNEAERPEELWNAFDEGIADAINAKFGGKMSSLSEGTPAKVAAWEGSLKSGKTFESGQDENGMCWGQITDEMGSVESATTANAMSEVWAWLKERGEEPTEGVLAKTAVRQGKSVRTAAIYGDPLYQAVHDKMLEDPFFKTCMVLSVQDLGDSVVADVEGRLADTTSYHYKEMPFTKAELGITSASQKEAQIADIEKVRDALVQAGYSPRRLHDLCLRNGYKAVAKQLAEELGIGGEEIDEQAVLILAVKEIALSDTGEYGDEPSQMDELAERIEGSEFEALRPENNVMMDEMPVEKGEPSEGLETAPEDALQRASDEVMQEEMPVEEEAPSEAPVEEEIEEPEQPEEKPVKEPPEAPEVPEAPEAPEAPEEPEEELEKGIPEELVEEEDEDEIEKKIIGERARKAYYEPGSAEFDERMLMVGPGPGDKVKLDDGTETEWSMDIDDRIVEFMPGMGPQKWYKRDKTKEGSKKRAQWGESEGEPQEDDYVIDEYTGVSQYGKLLFEFTDWDDVEKKIKEHANQENFWPSVWMLSDHGNFHLIKDWSWQI